MDSLGGSPILMAVIGKVDRIFGVLLDTLTDFEDLQTVFNAEQLH